MSACNDCGFTVESRALPDSYRAELEDAATCNRLLYWRHVLRLESLERRLAPARWQRTLTRFARQWRRAFDNAELEGGDLAIACEVARRTVAVGDLGPAMLAGDDRMPLEWRAQVKELGDALHGFAPAWWRDRPLERTLMVGTSVSLALPPHDMLGRPLAQRFRVLPLTLDRLANIRELGTVVDTVVVEAPDVAYRVYRHDGYLKALTFAARLLARTMGLIDGGRAITPDEVLGVRVTAFTQLPNGQFGFVNEEIATYLTDELEEWFVDTCMERAEWGARRPTAEQHAWPRVALATGPCGLCEFRTLCELPASTARELYRDQLVLEFP